MSGFKANWRQQKGLRALMGGCLCAWLTLTRRNAEVRKLAHRIKEVRPTHSNFEKPGETASFGKLEGRLLLFWLSTTVHQREGNLGGRTSR